ncbi:MAG: VOC family protein [Hyphomicrobiales bacterium]|nr:VOC family protein [Hyphomicrobiales bacterium]
MIKQLAHVCIFSKDLDATEQFFSDVLGMKKAFSFTRSGDVFGFYLHAGGRSHVEVFYKPEAAFDEADQINHLCLEVEDLDETITAIRAKGVDVTDKKKGCDDTWQAWTKDPSGVKIELFEYTDQSAQFVGRDREADW